MLPRAVHLQNGIQQRRCILHVAIGIDGACEGIIDARKAFAGMGGTGRVGGSAPGTVTPAHFPLLGQLPVDFLPVESNLRVQAAHIPLVLRFQCVVTDAQEGKIFAADFGREIAKALLRRDKGAVLLALHFQSMINPLRRLR